MYRLIPIIGALVPIALITVCSLAASGIISQPMMQFCIAAPMVLLVLAAFTFFYIIMIAVWYNWAKDRR